MSECYVCGRQFTKSPADKIPRCAACVPKTTAKMIADAGIFAKAASPKRRFSVGYKRTSDSPEENCGVIAEKDLRNALWDGNTIFLSSTGNGPSKSGQGNYFWTEIKALSDGIEPMFAPHFERQLRYIDPISCIRLPDDADPEAVSQAFWDELVTWFNKHNWTPVSGGPTIPPSAQKAGDALVPCSIEVKL